MKLLLDPKNELLKKRILLKDINFWLIKNILNENIYVKIRSTGRLIKSKLNFSNDKGINII